MRFQIHQLCGVVAAMLVSGCVGDDPPHTPPGAPAELAPWPEVRVEGADGVLGVQLVHVAFDEEGVHARFDVSSGRQRLRLVWVDRGAGFHARLDDRRDDDVGVELRLGTGRLTLIEWANEDRLTIEVSPIDEAIRQETYRDSGRELTLLVPRNGATADAQHAFEEWFPARSSLNDNELGQLLMVLLRNEGFLQTIDDIVAHVVGSESAQPRLPNWMRRVCAFAKICTIAKCPTANMACFGCGSVSIHCILFEEF